MANRYWVGGAGTWDASSTTNWSATSGGASGASAPTTSDIVYFDTNSGSGIVIAASGATCSQMVTNAPNITVQLTADFTMVSNWFHQAGVFDLNGYTMYAGLCESITGTARTIAFGATGKMVLNRTASISYVVDFYGAVNATITGNPVVEIVGNFSVFSGARVPTANSNPVSVYVKAGTGTFQLASGASSYAQYKTLDFTGFNGSIILANLFISGDLAFSSGMTIPSGASTWTFNGASKTQNVTTNGKLFSQSVTIDATGSTIHFLDALNLPSNGTLTLTNGTVQLKAGVTSTVGAFATSGTNQKFLESALAGAQATLSQASGTVNASYLTIKDINATGGATWNALWSNNNVDAGDNTGWVFGDPPITLATEYTYALRSFTQPRRF